MDSIAASSGATRPSLIPEEWAVQQLKTHWPNLEILELFPLKAKEMVFVTPGLIPFENRRKMSLKRPITQKTYA